MAEPEPSPAEGHLPSVPKRPFLEGVRDYFAEEPTLLNALVPSCLVSMVLFTRAPSTNFIFDEQEALLANPYVRAAADPGSHIGWLQAFKRDFWGLTPDRTIGSYRPLPDIVWRVLWKVGFREQSAFPHAYINVLIHGLNGALVVLLVARWTRDRLVAWLAGATFVTMAVLTEAVSGVVGLADVLGGTGALLALLALGLSLRTMPFALLGAVLVGLYAKESALCLVPLVPVAALMTAQVTHPERPLRWARAALAAAVTGAAFVFYVEMRRHFFPVSTPSELTVEANAGRPLLARAFSAALRWYAQPLLPHDPLNNPLIEASPPYRVAGALRVYARGLAQVLVPWRLSGDYSAPQEPIPTHLVFFASVAGAAALVLPILACPVVGLFAWRRTRGAPPPADPEPLTPIELAPVVAFALAWVAVSFIPVSNIPVVLPTVRAERFWYFPAIGLSIPMGLAWAWILREARRVQLFWVGVVACVLFFDLQCFAARRHAFDYTNDLTFWDATRKAVPRSAKAHLNYSVMLGARGDLAGRLASNEVALELAPQWPMASVYLGDTLCRMHRAPEAVQYFLQGFRLGPNDMSLIGLGLQCLWDEHAIDEGSEARAQLQAAADGFPGSWLKYIVDDTVLNGDDNKGVNPKYRPRGYNEGPKKDE
jgi:hypothetical protein